MPPNPSRLSSYRQSVARRLFYTHLWVGLALSFGIAVYFYVAAERALDGTFQDRFVESVRAFALAMPATPIGATEIGADLDERLQAALSRHPVLQSAQLLVPSAGPEGQLMQIAQAGSVQTQSGAWPALPADAAVGSVQAANAGRAGRRNTAFVSLGEGRWLYLTGQHQSREGYLADLRLHALVAFIGAVLLAGVMAALLSRDTRRVLQRFAGRCQEIAEGRFAGASLASADSPTLTEFGDLADALEEMAQRLARVDSERSQALEEARQASSRLEDNVRERTAELDRLNSVLRKEIEQRCQLEAVLAEAAATDALTRLLNRRGMVELLEQLAARTHQQRRHFAVAIADIDHFKSINDRYGHPIGDRVLSAVANRLRRDLKGEETAARWGGEEFLMVWPEIPLADAERRANRLREQLASEPLFEGAPPVTISFGLVEYSGLEPLDACLVRADQALYKAKELGRNRVVVS